MLTPLTMTTAEGVCMTREEYMRQIQAFRLNRPSRTSAEAYAQMDRMMGSTRGPLMMSPSVASCAGASSAASSLKDSSPNASEGESTTSPLSTTPRLA